MAFSPDGKKVLTGFNFDETAKLWDIATGEILQTFATQSSSIISVAFSSDGSQILTGGAGSDNSAKLWDVVTGDVIRTFPIQTAITSTWLGWVWSVALSPDGNQVLTGSNDGTAILWDVKTGTQIRTFTGHSDPVYSAVFSPDGTQVVTGSADNTARLWGYRHWMMNSVFLIIQGMSIPWRFRLMELEF